MAFRRSKHVLSHYHLTTFDQGYIVPVGCVEVLPGDTFRHSAAALLRVTPLVRPLMHPVGVSMHFWFAPNRILWNEGVGDSDNWEDFITQNDDTAALPTITLTGSNEDLVDRLGVPPTSGLVINALPVRAYNMIYNEFYRDSQLNAEVSLEQTDLLRGSWQRDYFTTCRPNAQQGSGAEQVEFPISGIGWETGITIGGPRTVRETGQTSTSTFTLAGAAESATPGQRVFIEDDPDNAGFPNVRGQFDINLLREGYAVQRWREHRNRFGDRYVDLMAAMGVNMGDARLQRPEFLGGGKQLISFSEVLSTANTSGSSGQALGDFAGHGIAAMQTPPYKRFFPEYGYMIAVMIVRPRTVYMDSIHKTFIRSEYDDWWSPQWEALGNQPVTETEIYAPGGNTNAVFGYQSRHEEYRRQPSLVSGDFRTSGSDDWHMARDFSSAPALNGSFVQCDPTDRIYADTGEPEIYAMVQHSLVARRLVSKKARNP